MTAEGLTLSQKAFRSGASICTEPAANRAVRFQLAGDDHAKAAKDCEGDEQDDDNANHYGMPPARIEADGGHHARPESQRRYARQA
jgi:hypothetical protein